MFVSQAFLYVVAEAFFEYICGVHVSFVWAERLYYFCHCLGFEAVEFVQFAFAEYDFVDLGGRQLDDVVVCGEFEDFWVE